MQDKCFIHSNCWNKIILQFDYFLNSKNYQNTKSILTLITLITNKRNTSLLIV